MSFATAAAELQTALDAISGLHEFSDPRTNSLEDSDSGEMDGAYLLRAISFEPWPEASRDASLMLATMELQVCTVLTTDKVTQTATVSSRAKAIYDALLYTSHSNGCVINSQKAQHRTAGRDWRMLWEWRFGLRYTEA